jgi:hypothetical protein
MQIFGQVSGGQDHQALSLELQAVGRAKVRISSGVLVCRTRSLILSKKLANLEENGQRSDNVTVCTYWHSVRALAHNHAWRWCHIAYSCSWIVCTYVALRSSSHAEL